MESYYFLCYVFRGRWHVLCNTCCARVSKRIDRSVFTQEVLLDQLNRKSAIFADDMFDFPTLRCAQTTGFLLFKIQNVKLSVICISYESQVIIGYLKENKWYCASLIRTGYQTSKCCPLIWPLKKFSTFLVCLCVVPQTAHTRTFISAQRFSTELFWAVVIYSWGAFANSDSECTLAQTGQFLNWECCWNIPFIQSTALFEWQSAVWAACSVWGDRAAQCSDCGLMGELTEIIQHTWAVKS